MEIKYLLVALSVIIILLCVFILVIDNKFINQEQFNNVNSSTNQTQIIDNSNNSSTNVIDPFYIQPSDYVINQINWSNYPNLQKGYVLAAYKAAPNDVLNYDFIEVQICTEIKNSENETLIKEQLSGVAKEAKLLYGPVSSITIAGTRGGAAEYFAEILPYNDTVHLP